MRARPEEGTYPAVDTGRGQALTIHALNATLYVNGGGTREATVVTTLLTPPACAIGDSRSGPLHYSVPETLSCKAALVSRHRQYDADGLARKGGAISVAASLSIAPKLREIKLCSLLRCPIHT